MTESQHLLSEREVIEFLVIREYPLLAEPVWSFLRADYYKVFVKKEIDDALIEKLWERFPEELVCSFDLLYGDQEEIDECEYPPSNDRIRRHLFKAVSKWSRLHEGSNQALRRLYQCALKADAVQKAKDLSEQERFAFFNGWEAKAGLDHWRTMAALTVEEAAALTLGRNPSIVNSESLATKALARFPFVVEFHRRVQQIERALMANVFSEPFDVDALAEWAAAKLPNADDWLLRQRPQKTPPPPSDEVVDDSRHYASLSTLIVGMAIAKHGMTRSFGDGERTGVVSSILRDLEDAHLYLDEKTVRKVLKSSLEYLEDRQRFKKRVDHKRPINTAS